MQPNPMTPSDVLAALQAGADIRAAADAVTYITDSGAIALPTDFTLRDLEPFLSLRRRMRGQMQTSTIDGFANYVQADAELGAAVFVAANELSATAYLNLGTPVAPGHADNTAKLTLPPTAAYAALLRATVGAPGPQVGLSQRAAAEFLEDWAANIECQDEDGKAIGTPKAIAALRKLTIESSKRVETEQQQLRATSSAFEQVQATSVEQIPAVVSFVCTPAQGLQSRDFRLRLGVLTSDKAPTIVLRVIKMEEHTEAMSAELAGLIAKALSSDAADMESSARPIAVYVGEYRRGA